jgi:predicted MPP superfamily phosphohydrolase
MEEIDIIKQENNELKDKVKELEERLKKYTNGDNHKRYYEKNKDKIKEQGSNYLKKLKEENPEKLKEYRRKYYLKKKEEMKNKDIEKN